MTQKWWRRAWLKGAIAGLLAASGALVWVNGSQAQQGKTVELNLISFAVTKAAHDRIIPAFITKWRKETGETVRFRTSYAGSGTQARAVIDGLQADVVHLALGLDVDRIEKAGLIRAGWQKRVPNNGNVSSSIPVIIVRPGNPKKIQDWPDLARPDVRIVTANPKTSGGARWNYLTLWGAITQTGGNATKAQQFVTQVYRNAVVLPKDAREATDAFFKQGQGDALINYENEALLATDQGVKVTFVRPKTAILIENPIAVVDRYVDKRGTRKVAEAFVQYLFTEQAQREFARTGFRPVNAKVAQEFRSKYPPVGRLYTVQALGGWDKVQQQFFADGAIFDRIQANLR